LAIKNLLSDASWGLSIEFLNATMVHASRVASRSDGQRQRPIAATFRTASAATAGQVPDGSRVLQLRRKPQDVARGKTPSAQQSKNIPVPTPYLRLVPVPSTFEVIHRRKPLTQRIREAGGSLAVIRDDADWRELSEIVFGKGDRRLVPDAIAPRVGNVIPMPLPGRRSTHAEILEVMREDIARGK
jgi:hypothetical protein